MKKIILLFCVMSVVAMSVAGCGKSDDDSSKPTDTQPPTQQETVLPTQPPTQPPTQLPTVEATTQPPTEAEYVPQEPETFYTIIEEPITTPPPTEAPTLVPTQADTEDTSEFSTENETVQGSWTLAYYERNGRHVSPRTDITYTFNLDGTFTVSNSGIERTGRYSFNGKILSYVSDVSGEIGNFTFDEDKDILTDEDSGNVAVFMRDE